MLEEDAESKESYNRGLNDAWELARKIVSLLPEEGGYSCYDMRGIFGPVSLRDISNKFTVQEALAKSQEYEKKKAEEEAKLVPGDVVEIKNMSYGDRKAIFIKYEDDDAIVLFRKGGSTRLVGKDVWTIVKTGKHVDISELVEVLYD